MHAGKGQATRAPMFSPCYLFIVVFLFSFLYCRACIFFFVQLVPSDSEVGDEKSVLTRTKTLSITICFKEPCHLLPYFSRGSVFFFLLFIVIRTWK